MTWISARIATVTQETAVDRTFRFEIDGADRDHLSFQPGQYVTLRNPAEDPPAERPYSLSGAPDGPVRITVRGLGAWGQAVYTLEQGTPVELKSPEGSFVLDVDPGDALVLVAGGSGITPFRAFVEHLIGVGHTDPVTVLQSTRTADHLLFGAEFRAWADAHDWLTYRPAVTDEAPPPDWAGDAGMIDAERMAQCVVEPVTTTIYACGPGPLVEMALGAGEALGITSERLRRESW